MTLEHLADCEHVSAVAVLCWEDQQAAVEAACESTGANVLPIGPRNPDRHLHDLAAAQRWADGWRGGLMSSTPFDAGYHAAAAKMLCDATDADALLLADPASAFLDESLIDTLITHARTADPALCREGLFFTPAAPGLTGLLLRRDLVDQLAKSNATPGTLLAYNPRAPRLDPVAADWCCHATHPIARSLADFRMRSDAQVQWAGTTLSDGVTAEALCHEAARAPRRSPVEFNIDLTSSRRTSPIWLREREDTTITLADLSPLLKQAGDLADDLRMTFGGRGDPLCHAEIWQAIGLARESGITAIHVETDLLPADGDLAKLLTSGIDVLSVHLPAMTAAVYESVMGTARLPEVLSAMSQLMLARTRLSGPAPLLVPTFVKLAANVGEMEAWYDQWLGAAGSAVVRGPDSLGNEPPAGIEASPLQRTERVAPALNVFADGTLRDHTGRRLGTLHDLRHTSLSSLWDGPTAAPLARAA